MFGILVPKPLSRIFLVIHSFRTYHKWARFPGGRGVIVGQAGTAAWWTFLAWQTPDLNGSECKAFTNVLLALPEVRYTEPCCVRASRYDPTDELHLYRTHAADINSTWPWKPEVLELMVVR